MARRAVVVGGGIGGIAAAVALTRAGIDVRVGQAGVGKTRLAVDTSHAAVTTLVAAPGTKVTEDSLADVPLEGPSVVVADDAHRSPDLSGLAAMLGDPRFDSVTVVLTVAAGSAAGTLARWGLDRERAVTVPLGGLGRKEIGQIVAGRGFPPFRPWNFGPLSVDFPAPKFGAHGHIADGGSPETSLKAHNPRSAAYTSGGGSGLTKK